MSATPHRCPICSGNGLVPNGFYTQTSGYWTSSNLSPEQCRSCFGTGIVWCAAGAPNENADKEDE